MFPDTVPESLSWYWESVPPNADQKLAAKDFFQTYRPQKAWTATEWRTHNQTHSGVLTPEVAFVGSSNVGKSSLLNALLFAPKLNHIGPKPGKTTTMHAWGLSATDPVTKGALKGEGGSTDAKLAVLDMPGYGFASRRDWGTEIVKYMKRRKQLRRVFVLMDAEHGPKKDDVRMLELLKDEGIPHQIIASKCDKIRGAPFLLKLTEMRAAAESKRGKSQLVSLGEILAVGSVGDGRKNDRLNVKKMVGVNEVRWAVLTAAGLEDWAVARWTTKNKDVIETKNADGKTESALCAGEQDVAEQEEGKTNDNPQSESSASAAGPLEGEVEIEKWILPVVEEAKRTQNPWKLPDGNFGHVGWLKRPRAREESDPSLLVGSNTGQPKQQNPPPQPHSPPEEYDISLEEELGAGSTDNAAELDTSYPIPLVHEIAPDPRRPSQAMSMTLRRHHAMQLNLHSKNRKAVLRQSASAAAAAASLKRIEQSTNREKKLLHERHPELKQEPQSRSRFDARFFQLVNKPGLKLVNHDTIARSTMQRKTDGEGDDEKLLPGATDLGTLPEKPEADQPPTAITALDDLLRAAYETFPDQPGSTRSTTVFEKSSFLPDRGNEAAYPMTAREDPAQTPAQKKGAKTIVPGPPTNLGWRKPMLRRSGGGPGPQQDFRAPGAFYDMRRRREEQMTSPEKGFGGTSGLHARRGGGSSTHGSNPSAAGRALIGKGIGGMAELEAVVKQSGGKKRRT